MSNTPETDAHQAQDGMAHDWLWREFARKLERQRNEWRDEHDRILREYQHRLMMLATSAIEATKYPEKPCSIK